MSSTSTEYAWPTFDGKLEFLPATSTEKPDVAVENITPARRDWLPDLLERLLPWVVEAVQEVAKYHDPKLLQMPRKGRVPVILNEFYKVQAVAGWYSYAAADFTIRVGDSPPEEWPSRQSDERPPSVDTLVKIGTGYDELNTGIDHLEPGPVQLIALAPSTPRVSLLLDESTWRSTQRAQRKRGLETIAILSKSCEIDLVASPSLRTYLEHRHPDWVDTYLTESDNTCAPDNTTSVSVDNEVDPQSIYESLQTLTPKGGKLQLLAALPSKKAEYREIRELKADSSLDLSPCTIDKYYRELEQNQGFFAVDDRGRYNSVTLTPAGRYAQGLLTEDLQTRHPQQARFSDDPPTPPNSTQE
jgi:hypothetical protein